LYNLAVNRLSNVDVWFKMMCLEIYRCEKRREHRIQRLRQQSCDLENFNRCSMVL